jgi:hypothetical protein
MLDIIDGLVYNSPANLCKRYYQPRTVYENTITACQVHPSEYLPCSLAGRAVKVEPQLSVFARIDKRKWSQSRDAQCIVMAPNPSHMCHALEKECLRGIILSLRADSHWARTPKAIRWTVSLFLLLNHPFVDFAVFSFCSCHLFPSN